MSEPGNTEVKAISLFNGIWKTVESVDYEDFLKAVDVGITWRVLSSGSKPSIEIAINGNQWTLKTHTLLKTHELKFTLGEEFIETRLDGVRVKTTCTLENGKLVQRSLGDKEIIIVRELHGDDLLKTTFSYKDITAIRVYKRSTRITR
ncbi:fatty acid-binding protein-like [Varroa jacobsoni]|uniref:Lipocalin/cytosolic fatty-acid binding domain-containing protein n=1 Tax=Varroa destructor TaxID=109461 RepID=A0A7M7L6Q0_VARDE|nr:fatty acid-binding protein-like [Varroa destructor]XP_022671614.1 fatty acid-binding protein-like [Varroa destructor]XP_022692192.1 fatty acid-binding protein-like [Varroa jacobsoni]XP_022692193.1 fatty acid-binding protein-like [Varroa jacobsoni]